MIATLNIRDESMFGGNVPDYFFTLNFPSSRVSVREIIERRVREEVENYNSAQPEVFRGLVQPTHSERVLNGFKFKEKKQIDWREQYKKAVEAFERNGFILLVDDLQVEDIDQIIEIEAKTSVTFLKLVPLVGG
jgi:hypothetical protein